MDTSYARYDGRDWGLSYGFIEHGMSEEDAYRAATGWNGDCKCGHQASMGDTVRDLLEHTLGYKGRWAKSDASREAHPITVSQKFYARRIQLVSAESKVLMRSNKDNRNFHIYITPKDFMVLAAIILILAQ